MNISYRISFSEYLKLTEQSNLPRQPEYSKSFIKLLDKWKQSGQHAGHIKLLKETIIPCIINRKPIPPEFKDHPLKGTKWSGHRECHLGGDALFVYKLPNNTDFVLVAVGSHSELFS